MKTKNIHRLIAKFPLLTKEKLYDLYIVREKSLPIIHAEYGIHFGGCLDLLEHYGIPKRNRTGARHTDAFRLRMKTSLNEKYGVDNPSQIEAVKQKKRDTFKKHYGVDNIWKSPEYYEWLNDYMLITYGVKRLAPNPWGWAGAGIKRKSERIKKLFDGRDKWWDSLSDEEKSIKMAVLCNANTFCSKIETRVANALNRLHISNKQHITVGRRNFDFEIDQANILIEVNGDFWHANPKIYDANDLVHFPNGDRKAKDIWKNDETKKLTAEAKGYILLTIWESDLKSMSDRKLEELLLKTITI